MTPDFRKNPYLIHNDIKDHWIVKVTIVYSGYIYSGYP